MPLVVPVKFTYASRDLWFDPQDLDILEADYAICSTERGTEIGLVTADPFEVPQDEIGQPLKPVLRVASDIDLQLADDLAIQGDEAMVDFRRLVKELDLEMKPVGVEYLFGGEKAVFYFAAEERVDFRQLVKDLSSTLHIRVDMRQIGVRDESKMLGGLGLCGQPFCCSRFLKNFQPVSIKMAKEQNLSLNPTKISGVCGRLMCCLKYEQDTYEYLNSRMPSVGEKVKTPDGIIGEVKSVSVLRQLVRVVIDNGEEKELREYTVDDLRLKPRQKKDVKLTEEELRELKDLEDSGDETMEDKSQEKPQRNRGHRDNKNEYRERRDKRDNRERRPYRADIEAAEASANETNEVNAANAGRENKDGYKKPYKGGKNRPNKQKYNRNKDYKNKNYNKEYNKDYNRDKDNGSTDTQ